MQLITALSLSKYRPFAIFSPILLNEAPPSRLLAGSLVAVQEKPHGRQKTCTSCGTRRRRLDSFTLGSLCVQLLACWQQFCGVISLGLPEFLRLLSFTFYLFPSPYLDNSAGDFPLLQHFSEKDSHTSQKKWHSASFHLLEGFFLSYFTSAWRTWTG